jgi:hypothetical protein
MSKGTFFRHIKDEESQNDFFVSLLSWSLNHDARALNTIHNNLHFTDEAEVIATQRRSDLENHPENDKDRTLDWVIGDSDKIVGYESKTGSSAPKTKQLTEELRKLKMDQNSGGRDVYLFAVTDHTVNPLDGNKFEWLSWYEVAERIRSLEATTDSIKILQNMFKNENYEKFSGFDEFAQTREWFIDHEKQFVRLAFEVDHELDKIEIYTDGKNHLPHHNNKDRLDYAYKYNSRMINQSILNIPFHPAGEPEYVDNQYDLLLMIPALQNRLAVYMHINTGKEEQLKEFVEQNVEDLLKIINEHEMELRTSWNRLNHPDRELKIYSSHNSIRDVLDDKIGEKYWKRLYFGWEIDTEPDSDVIVNQVVEKINKLFDIFYDPAAELIDQPNWM